MSSKRKDATPPERPGTSKLLKPGDGTLRGFFTASTSAAPDEAPAASSATQEEEHQDQPFDTAVVPEEPQPQEQQKWPALWKEPQIKEFQDKYPWLDAREGKLGCKVCQRVEDLGLTAKMGTSIAREWIRYTVSEYGASRTSQLSSLRKKINLHKTSAAHEAAEKVLKQQGKSVVTQGLGRHGAASNAETERIFRTVYEMTKSNLPFTELPNLVQLQKLNGAKMGTTLQSRLTAANITVSISEEMRRRMVKHIMKLGRKISVLIDEDTTISKKPVLVVVVRTDVSEDGRGEPVYLLLDLVELSDLSAEGISNALLLCLLNAGFTREFLEENSIGLTTDGASVMLGKKSGVAKRMKDQFPLLFIWHCMAHHLELSVADAVNDTNSVYLFKSFMDKMYSVYSQSTKANIELKEIAADLSTQVLKLGRILETRWVPSSFRSVHAVWTSYRALHEHFVFASQDPSRKSEDKAPFLGLIRRLIHPDFVHDLGLMYDVLELLSNMSKTLQKQTITLPEAHRRLETTVRVLRSFKDNPGPKYCEALDAIEQGSFHDVQLSDPDDSRRPRSARIPANAFLDKLVESMVSRLLDPSLADFVILDDLAALDTTRWPESVSIRHGEAEAKRLCGRFNLDESAALLGLRDLIDGGPGDEVQPLLQCIRVLPCTTAEAERMISHMNIVADDVRGGRLLVTTLKAILFVRVNGPPLDQWDPVPYVTKWKLEGHRSALDPRVKPLQAKPLPEHRQEMVALWKGIN